MPVDVGERVEFLSGSWVGAARDFLERALEERPELRDTRFSLCEVFSEAPPGLGAPENRAAWSFRIGDGKVEVAGGEVRDADLRVEGDYQHVLALAQTVYAAGPEATARAQRELTHRSGGDALRLTGRVPDSPPLQALLADLHDHMAARTVENADLEHRARRLGLARNLEELREQGYTVIEGAFSEAFASELRERVADEVRRHHPITTNGLLLRHRLFEEVALHPLACTVAESAVGLNMILGAMSGTYKETGPGAIDLHADYPLVRDPFPEFALIAVACWALDDWTEEAGPTWVVPGSHRRHRAPRRGDSREGAVPVLMPRGSIAFWSHGVWHWQGDRTAPGARVAIHVTYNRVFVRPLDDLSGVDDAMLARNPPAFSTLMGRDDPFGKSSFQGHDMRRFAYAAPALRG